MEDSPMEAWAPAARRTGPLAAAVILAIGGIAYAVHEHHVAQHLAVQDQQASAALTATRSQMNQLAARVNTLVLAAQVQAQQTAAEQAAAARPKPVVHRIGKPHAGRPLLDRRLSRMQAQLDQQAQEIAATRGDLATTSTQLGGSIARNHDELVVLERKGQRNYFEFDLNRSKQFQREGPLGVSLRKANTKHQFANLELLVDDRSLAQKHVNLYQPVMFYEEDGSAPIEVVINSITKNHIHGYVSAPAYRKSELTAMAASAASGTNPDTQAPPQRKVLTPQ